MDTLNLFESNPSLITIAYFVNACLRRGPQGQVVGFRKDRWREMVVTCTNETEKTEIASESSLIICANSIVTKQQVPVIR